MANFQGRTPCGFGIGGTKVVGLMKGNRGRNCMAFDNYRVVSMSGFLERVDDAILADLLQNGLRR